MYSKKYKKERERFRKIREEILKQRPIIQAKYEKYIKETYFDQFRQCTVGDLLKEL